MAGGGSQGQGLSSITQALQAMGAQGGGGTPAAGPGQPMMGFGQGLMQAGAPPQGLQRPQFPVGRPMMGAPMPPQFSQMSGGMGMPQQGAPQGQLPWHALLGGRMFG